MLAAQQQHHQNSKFKIFVSLEQVLDRVISRNSQSLYIRVFCLKNQIYLQYEYSEKYSPFTFKIPT